MGAKSTPRGTMDRPPVSRGRRRVPRIWTPQKVIVKKVLTVLLSRAFADFVESDFDLERVGEYPVRGFNDRIELFAYHG